MACHFSCYGTGLSNRPQALPQGAMLIVNDRTPVYGHDPELIAEQLLEILSQNTLSGVLLDFQRTDPQQQVIAQKIVQSLPCPVGVTAPYAKELACPVFLPLPPLYSPVEEALSQWEGREIWIDAALDAARITVTGDGTEYSQIPFSPSTDPLFSQEELHCSYTTRVTDKNATFTLYRDRGALFSLLEHLQSFGVSRAVGLYQELGN